MSKVLQVEAVRTMRMVMLGSLVMFFVIQAGCAVAQAGDREAIQTVTIGENAEFRMNGKPFLPIMVWLQDSAHFPKLQASGINTVAGYFWNEAEGKGQDETKSLAEYAPRVREAGFYFVSPYLSHQAEAMKQVAGMTNLLAWIQGDEPDMPETKSDGVVEAGKQMRVNAATPFARIIDGVTNSWTVVDPLEGGEFTIKPAAAVTVESVGVWATVSKGLAVAKEVTFWGDGKELLKVTLENKAGEQKFALPAAATLKELKVTVQSAYPGEQKWGSIGEVAGYDAAGKNVLVSKPYTVPKRAEEAVAAEYRAIKALDATRPVLMTFTAHFMKEFSGRFDAAAKAKVYPKYVQYCDAVGFDTYPVYGYNMPNKMYQVADGVTELRALAGPKRPVYAWIETNKGSQWTAYESQIEVKPMYTRAEVWMALIRGARGIAYFTHAWKPEYSQFALTEEMVKELARLNGQITRLAPALLATPSKRAISLAMADGLAGHWMATEHEGSLYVFAQNMDLGQDAAKLKQGQDITPRAGSATIRVEGLKAGTKIEVVDEGRTITAEDGQFADTFGPLAEHVYRLAL